MARIEIKSHRHTKVVSTITEVNDAVDEFLASDYREIVRETVEATFTIFDVAPFAKPNRSADRKILPETLLLSFSSINGREWRLDRANGLGVNVKKDGDTGASVEIHGYDFPQELKVLYGEISTYTRDNNNPAYEWVSKAYPR